MSIDVWDQQFDKLADECDMLLDFQSRSRVSNDRAFTLRTMGIMQEQDQLEQQIERLRHIAGRDAYLLPREKAMVHGVRTFVDRINQYSKLRSELLTEGLWFNLLKTRLLGTGPGRTSSLDTNTSEEIVALSVRQRSLASTEAYLEARLVQLDQRRRQLTEDYRNLDLEDANRAAAHTYATRLGLDPAAASKSPLMTSLKLYLLSAKAQASEPASLGLWRQKKERLEERTSGLLAFCRDIIMGCLRLGGPRPERGSPGNEIASLGRQLARVEAMAQATESYFKSALSTPITPSRAPIRVQKAQKPNKKKT